MTAGKCHGSVHPTGQPLGIHQLSSSKLFAINDDRRLIILSSWIIIVGRKCQRHWRGTEDRSRWGISSVSWTIAPEMQHWLRVTRDLLSGLVTSFCKGHIIIYVQLTSSMHRYPKVFQLVVKTNLLVFLLWTMCYTHCDISMPAAGVLILMFRHSLNVTWMALISLLNIE